MKAIDRNISINPPLLLVIFFLILIALVSIIPYRFLPFIIGGYLLLGIALFSLIKPIVLIYFVILSSSLAGLFQSFESISFGATDITVSGLRWIFTAGITLVTLGVHASKIRVLKQQIPFLLFAFLSALRWFISPQQTAGLKDILFYSLPVLTWIYTIFVIYPNKKFKINDIERVLLFSILIPLTLYIIFIPLGLVELSQAGPKGIINPRPVATYLAIIVALSLANWRYSETKFQRNRGMFLSFLAFGIILFTLSRLATTSALILFAMFITKSTKPTKFFLSGVLAAILIGAIMIGVPSFRARLFTRTPTNLGDFTRSLDTTGRARFWEITFNHAIQNPIFGWGPGTSRILVANTIFKDRYSEYHPHNEYLQVFHDMGIIGLLLLLIAWVSILFKFWKKWRIAHQSNNIVQAKWNMAATMGILLVLINALADNTLHYTFILSPVFIMVGCANVLNHAVIGDKIQPQIPHSKHNATRSRTP